MVKTKQEYPLVLTITNPAADDVSPSDCAQTPWIRCHFLVSVSLGCNHKTHSDKIDGLEHFFHALRLPRKVTDSWIRILGKCSMHGTTKYSQWNASKSNYGIELNWSQSMDWVPLSSAIERIKHLRLGWMGSINFVGIKILANLASDKEHCREPVLIPTSDSQDEVVLMHGPLAFPGT